MAGFSPAFQFYPKEWLSSAHITMMTPEQEGAYIRLLCHEWEDPTCSLPDDDAQLAVLSRLGERWLNDRSTGVPSCSTIVRSCFVPHPKIEGRIINKRLYREFVKQKKFREQRSKAGISSGKARGKNKRSTSVQRKRNDRSTTVEHPLNGEGTLQPSGVSPDNPRTIEKSLAEKTAFRGIKPSALINALTKEKVPIDRWRDVLFVVENSLKARRPPPPGVKDSPTGYALKIIETKAAEIRDAAAEDKAAGRDANVARFKGADFTREERAELTEKYRTMFPGIRVVFDDEVQPFEPDPEPSPSPTESETAPSSNGDGRPAPYHLLKEFPVLWGLRNRAQIIGALVDMKPDERLPALRFAMDKTRGPHQGETTLEEVVYQAVTHGFRKTEDPVHAADTLEDTDETS